MLARNLAISSVFAVLSACVASACSNATCTELHRVCDGASVGGGGLAGSGTAGTAGASGADGGSEQAGMPAGGSAGNATAGAETSAGDAGAGGSPPCADACKGATPICDTTTNTCVACIKSSDCKGSTPSCDVTTNTCVECAKSSDCKDSAKPLCDTTAKQCVACLAQGDCKAATASACNSGVCTACTKDEECTGIAGKGVCDAGTCVQCTGKNFAACGQDTGTPLVCDSLMRTCSSNKQGSAGLCLPCVSDAQCRTGQMCALDQFGNPSQQVGYFCHWKKGDTANGAPTSCVATGRPYVGTQVNVTSIDGTTSDICSLRSSTCVARNQFSSKDCSVTASPSDALCGVSPPNDAKCAAFDATNFRCTMTCLSDDDCPSPASCNTGVTPAVCSLN